MMVRKGSADLTNDEHLDDADLAGLVDCASLRVALSDQLYDVNGRTEWVSTPRRPVLDLRWFVVLQARRAVAVHFHRQRQLP